MHSHVGCEVPTGSVYEDQPLYFCDPEIVIAYSAGGPTDVSNIKFPVTVDTNVYSLYPGLLDTANLQFDYQLNASVWNETTSNGIGDWQFESDLDDFGFYSEDGTTNASLTEVLEVGLDG